LLHHARADAVLHDTAYNGAAVPEFRGEGDPWMHAGSPRALGKRRANIGRSEEHTSELQSLTNLVCRLLLEKKYVTSALGVLCSGIPSPAGWARVRAGSRVTPLGASTPAAHSPPTIVTRGTSSPRSSSSLTAHPGCQMSSTPCSARPGRYSGWSPSTPEAGTAAVRSWPSGSASMSSSGWTGAPVTARPLPARSPT